MEADGKVGYTSDAVVRDASLRRCCSNNEPNQEAGWEWLLMQPQCNSPGVEKTRCVPETASTQGKQGGLAKASLVMRLPLRRHLPPPSYYIIIFFGGWNNF